jgi:A/G-specific adenine glycosylase
VLRIKSEGFPQLPSANDAGFAHACKPVAAPDQPMKRANPQKVACSFAARLVDWQRIAGRSGLPWQGTRDPYRIWLSETMLQQTQVCTVIPYYLRFLERFPDVQTLAAAPLDDVLAAWSGLGYYSRARCLHRAARQVVDEHGGIFPREFAAVLALPGIGRSTAGAICAFAFGQRHAILDGNVKRVLARHAGIEGWAGDPAVLAALWAESVARLPPAVDEADATGAAGDGQTEIGTYTQALMDLGAGPCARSRPRCGDCPVSADCVARLSGRIEAIPAARPRREMPHRASAVWLLLDSERGVLLERRPPSGIWGGLWSLPQAIDAQFEASIRASDGALQALAPIEHAFTHFRLRIEPLLVRMHQVQGAGVAPQAHDGESGRRWVALEQLESVALPAPVRTLLEAVRSGAAGLQPRLPGLS